MLYIVVRRMFKPGTDFIVTAPLQKKLRSVECSMKTYWMKLVLHFNIFSRVYQIHYKGDQGLKLRASSLPFLQCINVYFLQRGQESMHHNREQLLLSG
jgi:hypothetical protein